MAALRLPAVPSYLVAVVVSQLLSPILWDHYAMLLLIPVAWLSPAASGGRSSSRWPRRVVLVGLIPPVVYPAAFWVTLVAVLVEGARSAREAPAPA